jgi:hypothetical protein
VALICYETCLLAGDYGNNLNPNTFIADSGASAHMVPSKSLLTNFKQDSGNVKIGDNSVVDSRNWNFQRLSSK